MNLFTDDDDTATEAPPVEPATVKQVRLLEGYSYRKEAVRKWTREKAEVVLRKCQQEDRISRNRALALAKEQDGAMPRGRASQPERRSAADYVEAAHADGAEELLQAVMYSLYVLTDDEAKRLAGYLIRLYRSEAGHGRGVDGGTGGGRDERRPTGPDADYEAGA